MYSEIGSKYSSMGYTQNPVSQTAADILYTFIPFEDAKDFDTKVKKANILESLNNAESGAEIRQLIEDNEKVFGTDIKNVMGAMSEKEIGVFLSLLGKTDFSKRSFEDAAEEFEAVAKCAGAEHWTQLAENLKAYAQTIKKYESSHSFDLSSYGDSKIEKVCVKMIENVLNSSSANDITDKFKSCLKAVTSEENKGGTSKPSGSGGSGGGGGGGGYVIGKSDGNATGNTINPGQNTNTQKTFSDMDMYEWAKTSVYELNKKGIISGKTDELYEPGSNITRAEFSKLVCRIFAVENGNGVFADVSEDSWYAPFVYALSAKGIVSGADGRFYPENDITREDAAVILCRAYRAKGISVSGEQTFEDNAAISDYAKDAVSALGSKKVIAGFDDGRFMPRNNLTRAEAAVLLYRVYCEIN